MDEQGDKTQKGAPEFPAFDERQWYAMAIASACVTAVLAAILLLWVIYGHVLEVSERISIAGGVVAFGGAATTFFTVAWRGLINARQADTAIEQIREAVAQGRRVERQLQATETNNLTSQFAQAAEMLSDDSKAKQRAGIALLRHIGLSPAGDFRREAMDLLLDYLRNDDTSPHSGRTPLTALQYADEIAQSIVATPFCRVIFDDMEVSRLPKVIRGPVFKQSRIIGARVGQNVRFENCKFMDCVIDASRNFIGVTRFLECVILKINLRESEKAVFEFCDFSGCERAAGVTPDMLNDCFHRVDAPPTKRVYAALGEELMETSAGG